MADASPKPLSPLWWLNKLETELNARQPQMALMDAYYRGEHPLPFVTKAHNAKMRDEFHQLLADSRANFMALVVDTCEERLNVEGFRLSASSDRAADQQSWDIWQANNMDQESQTALLESLIKGVSYLSVWSDDDTGRKLFRRAKAAQARIAIEDASQTIVGYKPGTNYRERAAAVKIWLDDWTGMKRANVYLPDAIYKYQAKPFADSDDSTYSTSASAAIAADEKPRWLPITDSPAEVRNPTGVVPIIPLRNRPRLLCEGESELGDVFRIQNQINGFLFLLALAGYFGAHRQRWAIGLTLMEDPVTHKPVEPFDIAVDRMIYSTNENAKFGEFDATDLQNYIGAIEQKVLHIAVTTRTPRHYLIQSGQSPSGDAIKSAESGLVRKVERKQRPFGEGLEEAIRLARRFAGQPDAPPDSEIVWASAETRTPSEVTDAVIKQYAEGLIPWEAALEDLGKTPTQIARYATMRAADGLTRELLNPQNASNQPPLVQP